MRRILLILLMLTATLAVQAQTNLDSLYSVWQDQTQLDSLRVKAYNEYIWNGFLFSNPDSAAVLAENLVAFSKENDYRKGEANGLSLLGISNDIQGNYVGALKYFSQGLQINEEIGNLNGLAGSLGNIGNIYRIQGNYSKAEEYFNRTIKIYEENGDKKGLSTSLANLGIIYQGQVNYTKALAYYGRSLKIKEEIGDIHGISNNLNNIGIIYQYQGDYPKALEYQNRALKINKESGNINGISMNLTNLGLVYEEQGNHPKALKYCKQGLAVAEELDALERQKENCQCLYNTYKALGKSNEALVYMEKMRVAEDSLNAEEAGQILQQMEFAKQALSDSLATAEETRLVQTAHQEEVRQKNRTRNMFAGGGLILFILAGGLYARVRYIRKSKATLQVEKDRSENLLLNILPADIAAELKEKGKAEARDFEMVSILFTDFKGFTAASEKLSAQDLVSEINTCFEAFDGIMGKYNIEKIKTIGDAYMAAGGLPVPTDDSVKNTVLAALEMQVFITKRKVELDAAGKPAFEMRVGIHTGPIVAGIVGVKKFQYDIWGDTVNTASRMESSGAVGKVNISQATYELLKEDVQFTFESRGKIEAKGKGEIDMFFVSKT